jgi:DNA-binding transcriptional LysR family regulator
VNMLDLRQLRALSAVAAEGSLSRAAAALEWSQPTVDHHVRQLERLVGAPVVLRGSRGSSLTPVGELLLERGEEALSAATRALQDARDFVAIGHATLRFGIFPSAAAVLLPAIVGRTDHLGIQSEVVIDEVGPLAERINAGELDAALLYELPGYELPLVQGLATKALHREPLELAVRASHRLASREAIDLPVLLELGKERWIQGLAEGDPIDASIAALFAAHGTALDGPLRTDDFSVIFGMVAAGLGIAVVPSLLPEVMHRDVARIRLSDPALERTLLLAHRAGTRQRVRTEAAVRQLEQAVRAALEADAPGASLP